MGVGTSVEGCLSRLEGCVVEESLIDLGMIAILSTLVQQVAIAGKCQYLTYNGSDKTKKWYGELTYLFTVF